MIVSRAQMLDAKPEDYNGLRLSVSKVKVFENCPAQFRYNYIERLPRKEWAHHVFGNVLHEVLEMFHKERLNGNESPAHVLMTTSFKAVSSLYKDKISMDARREAFGILSKYLSILLEQKKAGTAPDVIGVETSFYIDIGGEVLLTGYIDKEQVDVDDVLHVKDYKTTKHKKYLKKDWFQLETYAFVKFLQYPEINKIRGSYELLRHDFECLTKEFKRSTTMKMEQKFLDYAEEIKAEKIFSPSTSKLCAFCDYLEQCDTGRRFMLEDAGNMLKHGMIDW